MAHALSCLSGGGCFPTHLVSADADHPASGVCNSQDRHQAVTDPPCKSLSAASDVSAMEGGDTVSELMAPRTGGKPRLPRQSTGATSSARVSIPAWHPMLLAWAHKVMMPGTLWSADTKNAKHLACPG